MDDYRDILQIIHDERMTDRDQLVDTLQQPVHWVDVALKELHENGLIRGDFLDWTRDHSQLFSIARNIRVTPEGMDCLNPPKPIGDSEISIGETGDIPAQAKFGNDHSQLRIHQFTELIERLEEQLQNPPETEIPGVVESARSLLEALKSNPAARWAWDSLFGPVKKAL
jgi:hypothetical protein